MLRITTSFFIILLFIIYFFLIYSFLAFYVIYFKFRVQIIISYRINPRVAVTCTNFLNARVAVIDPEQG